MELPRPLLQALLERLLSRGGDLAEVYAEHRSATSARIDDSRVEEIASGEDRGVGLRLMEGGRTLYSSLSGPAPASLMEAAERLAAALGGRAGTVPRPFAEPRGRTPPPILRPPSGVGLDEKVEALRAADRGGRSHDPRVRQFTARYADSEQRIQVANSEGSLESDRRTYTTLHCSAVARQDGETRTGVELLSEMRGFELFGRRSPYSIGAEAARLAVLQLDARPAPAGTFTVVLSSAAGGTMVHEACGHGLEADFVRKGLSIYANRVGEKVAADALSVVDDGTLDYLRGSGAVDDEGTPTSRVTLIEDGVLRGYLHSRKSARELSMRPTGNGRRQSFRYPPIPRMRNTMILPGRDDPEEILRSVRNGIFVLRMGGGEVDITSGKFVFGVAEAYRIRDGRIAEPVRDASLIGTGPEVLASIDRVGTDLGFGIGTCGKDGQGVPVSDAQPTLRIPRMVIGGVDGGEGGMSALDAAVDAALQAFDDRGWREAEVFVEDSTVDSVAVAGGEVETVETDRSRGAGLRVVRDGRVGFSYTSDLTADGIRAAVHRAGTAAGHAEPDASHRLPEPGSPPDVEGNADPAVGTTPAAEKVALARRIEEAARAEDARVRATRAASYQDVDSRVLLGRAGGHRYGFRYTRAFGAIDLVAEEDGESQGGAFVDFAVGPGGLDPEAIGRRAARRAVRKLGGRPCATGVVPLLLAHDAVDGLLEGIGSIFFGENVLKGRSLLAGRLEEQVAAPAVHLVDDGRLPGGCNTAPIDGEGVEAGTTVLVEEGRLCGYLHDGFSAARMGVPSTGNAGRDSYLAAPETAASALCLRPTGETLADLLAAAGEGLWIEEVMGLHTINPVSGDFSLGAAGRAVRGGDLAEAVAGIAIAGSISDLLRAVAAVADDPRRMPGGNRVCSVLLEGLSVSGPGARG